ncbi:MAG: EAL domain-containing protein [Ruminococcaceae bacterium]|nr:EAL domain-containing protein [Oscillospiraceae bacterium]
MERYIGSDEGFAFTLKLLETVNHTTDDFLFVLDINQDTNWFFGNVDKDYAVRRPGEMTNTTAQMLDIVHPSDRKSLRLDLESIARGEKDTHDMTYRWINRGGEVVWINCRGRVLRDRDGMPAILIGRVSEEAMRHLYNPLTGLWNKTKLRQDLEADLKTCRGYLMLVDIDGLAAINLNHGRDYGDGLLREVAELLENMDSVRRCYHINHNNFAAVIDGEKKEDAMAVFADLSESMSGKCTFTAGTVPIDGEVFHDVGQLLDSANVTLKNAKNNHKEHMEFFSAEEIERRIGELRLLEELKDSVQRDYSGFEVYYQPQVRGGSYELFGAEALLRYTSETKGSISPMVFIPLLEQSGLIEQVGMWVLEKALAQLEKWRELLPSLHMSVNFSAVQFEAHDIAERIIAALNRHRLPGSALTVEITESVQFHRDERFSNHLKYLKAYGVEFAIDDFGTGYSNLGYLKQFNVDEIKIDRSFVSGVEKNSYNYNLISNVIGFARVNDIRVCCEGTETHEELAALEILRPDMIQGYLFDRPCTADCFEEKYFHDTSDAYRERSAFVERIYEYKEKAGIIHFDPRDILRANNVGLWIIRLDREKERFEMHADETMERILGIGERCTPTECYNHWQRGIHPDCLSYVHKNMDIMINEGKPVQLEYLWHHPTYGEVTVRCCGRRVRNEDGMVVLEGYHRILSDVEGA